MHYWGDEDVDWDGICDAATYIGDWLCKWARIGVTDYKEKFGTVRVYCSFGWYELIHNILYPGYVSYMFPVWVIKIDRFISHKLKLADVLNWIVIPIHKKLYRWRYKKAIQKWPHLKKEIVCFADWPEELKGL